MEIQGLRVATVYADPFEDIQDSAWNSRAWKFQEKPCSSRTLAKSLVVFWCGKTGWREDVYLETANEPVFGLYSKLNPLSDFVRSNPEGSELTVEKFFDIRFRDILVAYMQRSLSHETL